MGSVVAHGKIKQLRVFTSIWVHATGERLVRLLSVDLRPPARHVFQHDACGGCGGIERSIGDEKKVVKDV